MKILVAIDNSEYARNAIDYLISTLSKAKEKPEVTLLTVIDPSLPVEVLVRLGKTARERFQSTADEILLPVQALLQKAGIASEAIWELGDPAEQIAAKAEALKPGSILMGSRGLTALESLFFGSVTTGVLSRTKVPAIIVRDAYTTGNAVVKFGVAVDGSENSKSLVDYLVENRAFFPDQAEFHMIYVGKDVNNFMFGSLGAASLAASGRSAGLAQAALLSEGDGKKIEQKAFESVMEPLRAQFPKLGNVKEVLLRGKPGDEIAQYAEEEKLDMIIMGSHGRSNIETAFAGSVVMRVAAQGSVPLFIVR